MAPGFEHRKAAQAAHRPEVWRDQTMGPVTEERWIMKGCKRVVVVCLVLTVVAMMGLPAVLQAAEKQSGSVTVPMH